MSANDPTVVAWTLVVLGGATSLLMLWAFFVARTVYRQFKYELAALKNPRLIPYDESRMCLDVHSWTELDLILRGLPPGRYQACKECGVISGNHELMLSGPVLQEIREASELAAKEAQLRKDIQGRVNAIAEYQIDEYIRRNFTSTLAEVVKLQGLVTHAFAVHAEARQKVIDEELAQTELRKRYENWPDKVKGRSNAVH
jgi:hypothetical protein